MSDEKTLFEKIIDREIPSYKVYEDEEVCAFLDIGPINPGHTLVVPKKAEPNFYDLDDETYKKVMIVVKKISKAVKKTFSPEKVGLIVAGWDVPHAHIHVVPMNDYHDITSQKILDKTNIALEKKEMENIAEKIREALENI